jgi:hypothetical protein
MGNSQSASQKRAREEEEDLILLLEEERQRVVMVILSSQCDHRTQPRSRRPPVDLRQKEWSKMLLDATLVNYGSKSSKLFTRRFRVPFPVFTWLVNLTEEWCINVLHQQEHDCAGEPRIPTTLKVLGCLRMLGRGTCLDGINELSGISETCMSAFLKLWCAFIRKELFPKWVRPPETPGEIAAAMGPYCANGLNGAIGSTDAVHIHWDKCPKELINMHTGLYYQRLFFKLIFIPHLNNCSEFPQLRTMLLVPMMVG